MLGLIQYVYSSETDSKWLVKMTTHSMYLHAIPLIVKQNGRTDAVKMLTKDASKQVCTIEYI